MYPKILQNHIIIHWAGDNPCMYDCPATKVQTKNADKENFRVSRENLIFLIPVSRLIGRETCPVFSEVSSTSIGIRNSLALSSFFSKHFCWKWRSTRYRTGSRVIYISIGLNILHFYILAGDFKRDGGGGYTIPRTFLTSLQMIMTKPCSMLLLPFWMPMFLRKGEGAKMPSAPSP